MADTLTRLRVGGNEPVYDVRATGICDSSKLKHYRRHHQDAGHPLIRSIVTHSETKPIVHLEFGPTAWVALEVTESAALDSDITPDYTRILITPGGRARQSEVSLNEVLDTLSPDDMRLRDEVVQVIRESD